MGESKRLDPTVKQGVSYCIPLWLRDEQIKLAIQRTTQRLQAGTVLNDEPVAIVGYGPSLRDTWEQVREFKTIFSCSGAHRFLIDRGIIPTYQVAVDPLPKHTVTLIGAPHPDVKYLICSTCHPDVFDHLEGFDVTVWHSFSAEAEARRILPPGEWALTGGCDVGLRSIAVARFLGHRNLHIFGLDGSSPSQTDGRHAAVHPNPLQATSTVEWEGRTFYTTPSMLEAARTVEHELHQLPDVKATFYGDGLIQHMAKFFKPAPQRSTFTAFKNEPLISDTMRDLNQKLHRSTPQYGAGGSKHADTVLKLVEHLKAKSEHGLPSVLDYGCGKGTLAGALPFPIFEYDPAIPGKDEAPRPADLVVCTDVLEHVEPDKILYVLKDLQRCTKQLGYFVIHTGPAKKVYADGQNTHLTQRNLDWWKGKIKKFFQIGKIWPMGVEIRLMVQPIPKGMKSVPEPRVSSPKGFVAPQEEQQPLVLVPEETLVIGTQPERTMPPVETPAAAPSGVVPDSIRARVRARAAINGTPIGNAGTPLRVFIGYDERQPLAYTIAQHSILRHASCRVQIEPLILERLPLRRRGLTAFTYSRWLVPWLCDYHGDALFLDSDTIVRGDVAEIRAVADPAMAVSVVQNPNPTLRFEWASLMYFQCGSGPCRTLTPAWVENEQNHPATFGWVPPERLGRLPLEWNHLVLYDAPNPAAKMIHYTGGLPCWPETERCEAAALWHEEVDAALRTVDWDTLMGPSVHRSAVEALNQRRAPTC